MLSFLAILSQFLWVHSMDHVSNGGMFMCGGVAQVLGNDDVSGCGFAVYVKL
jgi:hypothetical protein